MILEQNKCTKRVCVTCARLFRVPGSGLRRQMPQHRFPRKSVTKHGTALRGGLQTTPLTLLLCSPSQMDASVSWLGFEA